MVNRVGHLLHYLPDSDMPRRREKEERSQLNVEIPESLHDSVREFSEESGIPMTRIVTDALRAYLTRNAWPERGEND